MRTEIVFVLNERFTPPSPTGPFEYGVVNFVLSATQALKSPDRECRFILYRRDESALRAETRKCQFLHYEAVEMRFHFRMPELEIRQAFESAFRLVTHPNCESILYHQSAALFPYSPKGIPATITHHSPFVEDFEKIYGPELAQEAFRGGAEKVRHLRRLQENAIRHLKEVPGTCAVEFSQLQKRLLLQYGVPETKVILLSPPTPISDVSNGVKDIERVLLEKNEPLLLFAAARLDAFKNPELFIDACKRLLNQGKSFQVLLIGDTGQSRFDISEVYRERFHFLPRLGRDTLFSLVKNLKRRTTFVCTSRYETFGYTPIEISQLGIPTLVPELPNSVELTRWIDPLYLYSYSAKGLAKAIEKLWDEKAEVKPSGSPFDSQDFEKSFRRLCAFLGEYSLASVVK